MVRAEVRVEEAVDEGGERREGEEHGEGRQGAEPFAQRRLAERALACEPTADLVLVLFSGLVEELRRERDQQHREQRPQQVAPDDLGREVDLAEVEHRRREGRAVVRGRRLVGADVLLWCECRGSSLP